MKVKILKAACLNGKDVAVGAVVTITEPGLAERWIEQGYAEEAKEPPKPPTPIETASVDTGEKATEKKPKPRRGPLR